MSPPLDPDKTYTYSVQAKWMENGKPMDQTRTVTVTPNQTAMVDFGTLTLVITNGERGSVAELRLARFARLISSPRRCRPAAGTAPGRAA